MNFKKLIINFIWISILAFASAVLISFLWNLLFHENAGPDWENSIRMALILGIVFSIIEARKSGK
jgi:hypothetical protein